MSKHEEYMEDVKNLYGHDTYNYSKIIYIHSHNLVEVECPAHGGFTRTAFEFKRGKGCPICAANKVKEKRQREKFKNFIEVSTKVHCDKYDYSKVVYTKMSTKVMIDCQIHGSFLQTPRNHMSGFGCTECGKDKCGNARRSNTKEFISKATKIHGDKYSYKKTKYVNQDTKVVVTCKEHGDFLVVPKPFLRLSSKCPKCRIAKSFDETVPAILYYLRVGYLGNIVYKIGITNRTVAQRYNAKDLAKITVLSEVKYELGELARQEETRIKREFKQHQWTGNDLLTDGNTELFCKDVLNLDKD